MVDSITDGRDGVFLVRPAQKGGVLRPLTLSLLYGGVVFNISIRRLRGGTYALGKEKKAEMVNIRAICCLMKFPYYLQD